jgi:hypothetical protein
MYVLSPPANQSIKPTESCEPEPAAVWRSSPLNFDQTSALEREAKRPESNRCARRCYQCPASAAKHYTVMVNAMATRFGAGES